MGYNDKYVSVASNATQLQSHDFIWALHSDSQETLLQSCVPNDAEWPALKALGTYFLLALVTFWLIL